MQRTRLTHLTRTFVLGALVLLCSVVSMSCGSDTAPRSVIAADNSADISGDKTSPEIESSQVTTTVQTDTTADIKAVIEYASMLYQATSTTSTTLPPTTTTRAAPSPPRTVATTQPVPVEPIHQEEEIQESDDQTDALPAAPSDSIRLRLECIVRRESGGDPTIVNRSSGASGLFQYLDSTWRSMGYASRYGVSKASYATPAQQWEAAFDTVARSGFQPWASTVGGC